MNIQKNSAVSLIELIIAIIIMGIVMYGITAFDYAIRQSHLGTSRNAVVAMQTSKLMLDVSKTLQRASGNITDKGIIVSVADGTLKIRLDTNTPADYTDDQWWCYDYDPASKNLRYSQLSGPGASCPDLTDLTLTSQLLGQLEIFQAAFDPTTASSVSVTINNRYDLTKPSDPITNPSYTLTTHITPASQSY